MNPAQKRELKAKAHSLKPVVIIGGKGLTPAVINEIDIALNAHELIKVSIRGMEKIERSEAGDAICESLHAEFIQHIGNTVVLYRKSPE